MTNLVLVDDVKVYIFEDNSVILTPTFVESIALVEKVIKKDYKTFTFKTSTIYDAEFNVTFNESGAFFVKSKGLPTDDWYKVLNFRENKYGWKILNCLFKDPNKTFKLAIDDTYSGIDNITFINSSMNEYVPANNNLLIRALSSTKKIKSFTIGNKYLLPNKGVTFIYLGCSKKTTLDTDNSLRVGLKGTHIIAYNIKKDYSTLDELVKDCININSDNPSNIGIIDIDKPSITCITKLPNCYNLNSVFNNITIDNVYDSLTTFFLNSEFGFLSATRFLLNVLEKPTQSLKVDVYKKYENIIRDEIKHIILSDSGIDNLANNTAKTFIHDSLGRYFTTSTGHNNTIFAEIKKITSVNIDNVISDVLTEHKNPLLYTDINVFIKYHEFITTRNSYLDIFCKEDDAVLISNIKCKILTKNDKLAPIIVELFNDAVSNGGKNVKYYKQFKNYSNKVAFISVINVLDYVKSKNDKKLEEEVSSQILSNKFIGIKISTTI